MDLKNVVAARQLLRNRPQWTAIIAKAFALTSQDNPSFLQSYICFPWHHIYEHQTPIANIAVERQHEGEDAVFFAQVRHPNLLSLTKIDAYLRGCKREPIETIGSFRRILVIARLPGLLRRLALWSAFHSSGRWRERYVGTFSITSTASSGAGMVQLITPMTGTLHYSVLDEESRLDMRLTFDQRVLGADAAARALATMENHLNDAILKELHSMNRKRAVGMNPGLREILEVS
ncbi:MAG: hypothetical protein K8T89_06510 [Planctomycetes bacterium]|nr:hypothetical protein [Planctomycetota bacterium]